MATAAATAGWSNWESLGGKLRERPDAVVTPVSTGTATSRVDVLVNGPDYSNWDLSYDGTSRQWTPLHSYSSSELAPATNSSQTSQIHVYERSLYGIDINTGQWGYHLRADYYSDAWGGSTPYARSGQLASEPTAVMWPQYDDVYVQGTDNQLWQFSQSFPPSGVCCPNGGWVASRGGQLSAAPVAVRIASSNPVPTQNEDVVFVRGKDTALWYWSSVTGWHSAGGRLAAKPEAIAVGIAGADAFVEGTDGALWHYSIATGKWDSAGGKILGSPSALGSAAMLPNGTPGFTYDVFVEGTDRSLWHAHFDGTRWHWEDLGIYITAPPSAVSWDGSRIDLFAKGGDGALWHRFFQ